MTIAEQFIADCKGKSVSQISDIEQKYYEDGLYDGSEGLFDIMDVNVLADYLSNGTLRIEVWNKPIFDLLSQDELDSIYDAISEYLDQKTGLNMCETSGGLDGDGTVFSDYAYYDESLNGAMGDFDIPVPASEAQKIIDQLAPGTVVGDNTDWHLTLTWDAEDDLENSDWRFSDGSTCDWDDLR